jgi:hypothetical protein
MPGASAEPDIDERVRRLFDGLLRSGRVFVAFGLPTVRLPVKRYLDTWSFCADGGLVVNSGARVIRGRHRFLPAGV